MKLYKFLGVLIVLALSISFTSCGDDDDDKDKTNNETGNTSGSGNSGGSGNTGNNTQKVYTINQFNGYWVDIEQWNWCKRVIKEIEDIGDVFSETYLTYPFISEGVEGYYITNGRAYEIFIETTTMKYANNNQAGNKILKSWDCIDGVTVYFMNVTGGKYNYACSIDENKLKISYNNYPIISTSAFIGPNNVRYEKVDLSL